METKIQENMKLKKIKELAYVIGVFLITLTLFSRCATQSLTNRDKEINILGVDFRKYNEEGFLFLTESYYGRYEVKGIITAELHPTVTYYDRFMAPSESYRSYSFYLGDKRYTKLISILDVYELIDSIYETSIEWGGDAFTNFSVQLREGNTDDSPNTSYTYYSISGEVILRIE